MASIKIHAGDFQSGTAKLMLSVITFPWGPGDGAFGKSINLSDLEEIDKASEESVKKLGGTVGWGVVGATLLGPVGLLAGLLAGGKGTEVTFVAKLRDGRKFLGSTDAKTFTKLQAAVF
jgi:hypothetical protein